MKSLNSEFLNIPSQFMNVDEARSHRVKLNDIPIKELFVRQATLDKAKQTLSKKEISALKALYFDQFIKDNKFNWKDLELDFSQYRSSFERHLGRDWVFFISSLLKLARESEVALPKDQGRPKGLLNVVR